jgi:hypothetical protein
VLSNCFFAGISKTRVKDPAMFIKVHGNSGGHRFGCASMVVQDEIRTDGRGMSLDGLASEVAGID